MLSVQAGTRAELSTIPFPWQGPFTKHGASMFRVSGGRLMEMSLLVLA